jgi:hypothetical protein
VTTIQRQWGRRFVRHEPGPDCNVYMGGDVHCYSCGTDEALPTNYYIVCRECNHVYKTDKELVDTYNSCGWQDEEDAKAKGWTPWPFGPVDDPEQVHFCPLCLKEL